jgi:hypothetical protein
MKRAIVSTLQVAITIAIVWWVFHDPAKRAEIVKTLLGAKTSWLLLGLVSYGLIEVLFALRWHLLLRVQNLQLSFRRVFGLWMIGVFFNFFIPGGTGGDAVKIFYLMKETPGNRGTAILSVIVDRLIGLITTVLFAGVLIRLEWQWLTSAPGALHWIYLALAILGGSLLFLALSFVVTGFGLVHRLPKRMPGRDKIAELALAYNLYGKAWRPSLAAMGVSLIAQLGYFGVFYCAIRALASSDMRVPSLTEFFAIMPIIDTILALPISIGGVGWREMLFETFFGGLCGASKGVAVAISSTGYLLTLTWGLVGALIYLAYRPTDHAKLRVIRSEVRKLEHQLAEEEVAMERKKS